LSLRGVATAQLAQTPRGDVRSVAVGSAGPVVAVAQRSSVEVIAIGAKRQVRLGGFRGTAVALALSVDGRLVAAGCADGSVRCWSLPRGELVAANRGRRAPISSVAVAPNGRVFASSDSSGSVFVWSIPGGSQLLDLPSDEPVARLAFSPDGVRLAAATTSQVIVWNVTSGAVEHTLKLTRGGVASGLAISPDGNHLALTTLGGTVSLRALPKPAPKRAAAPSKRRARPAPPVPWYVGVLRKLGAAAWAP
jgi:WD40 repeat protein